MSLIPMQFMQNNPHETIGKLYLDFINILTDRLSMFTKQTWQSKNERFNEHIVWND